jgi:Chlorophyll A-B binding protein
LRDYREAEIRHSRLAMLAAMIWPLQEMLDRLLLDEDLYGPLLYGPVTLPYFPLLMTAILLLLGYLDIYSMAIKEMDDIGDAYLPGDCFWDPLRILAGTAPDTKRRMQERELFNGRAAMLAVAAFVWEELVTGLPVIEVEGNELLFQPLYQVPFVQSFLDAQFSR